MKQGRTTGVRHRKAPFATFENSSSPPVHAEHAGTGAARTRPSRRPSRTAGHLGLTRSPGFTRGYSHPLPPAAGPRRCGLCAPRQGHNPGDVFPDEPAVLWGRRDSPPIADRVPIRGARHTGTSATAAPPAPPVPMRVFMPSLRDGGAFGADALPGFHPGLFSSAAYGSSTDAAWAEWRAAPVSGCRVASISGCRVAPISGCRVAPISGCRVARSRAADCATKNRVPLVPHLWGPGNAEARPPTTRLPSDAGLDLNYSYLLV